MWLQRKNDDDKKNRAEDARSSHSRQIPVKQVSYTVMLNQQFMLKQPANCAYVSVSAFSFKTFTVSSLPCYL